MSGLLELAERVEALAGPDRATNALIAVAINLGARGVIEDDHEYLSPVRKDDYGVNPGAYWFCCRSGRSLRMADHYTGSLDAAMTLVPEGFQTLDVDQDHDGAEWRWRLYPQYRADLAVFGQAGSACLALTAAALRARGTQQ